MTLDQARETIVTWKDIAEDSGRPVLSVSRVSLKQLLEAHEVICVHLADQRRGID